LKTHLIYLTIVLLAALAACSSGSGSDKIKNHQNLKEFYSIKKFVDGDTYWIDDGSEDGVKIRLIGIDAPEPRNYFKLKEEPFGKESSRYIKELIYDQKVRVELDIQERDRYGRVLAYCYLPDGRMVNEEMVKAGFAMVMTVPPNLKYQEKFLTAQQYARENKMGMWK
jgi:micrococcal nuclease